MHLCGSGIARPTGARVASPAGDAPCVAERGEAGKDVTVVEEDRDLERRVERLEDQQSSWWQLTTDLLARETRRDRRLTRMGADIGSLRTDVTELKTDVTELKTDVRELKTDVAVLKTEMTEVKGQLNRVELASARRFDKIDAQLETIRGLIAGREERGG